MDDDWFDYLLERHKSIKEEKEFFEYALRQLTGKLPEMIWDMVAEQMSWQELMVKYNVSHAMVGKYRKKAVDELQVIYSMRNQHSEMYMLD